MVHAYAIDPEAVPSLAVPERARHILNGFGVGTPRQLLEIPDLSRWRKLAATAIGAANLGETEKTLLADLLKHLKERTIKRSGIRYNGGGDWLNNAEAEHGREPYGAIISPSNPRAHGQVIFNEIGDNADGRWHRPLAVTPLRTVAEFVAKLSSLVRNCGSLHLIDQHFLRHLRSEARSASCISFVSQVAELLDRCDTIEIHCNAQHNRTQFTSEVSDLASEMKVGVRLLFHRWIPRGAGHERLHNRYVLSDIGGVVLGNGFDVMFATGSREDLNLMTKDQYDLRWGQYCGAKPAFNADCSPIEVKGTKI